MAERRKGYSSRPYGFFLIAALMVVVVLVVLLYLKFNSTISPDSLSVTSYSYRTTNALPPAAPKSRQLVEKPSCDTVNPWVASGGCIISDKQSTVRDGTEVLSEDSEEFFMSALMAEEIEEIVKEQAVALKALQEQVAADVKTIEETSELDLVDAVASLQSVVKECAESKINTSPCAKAVELLESRRAQISARANNGDIDAIKSQALFAAHESFRTDLADEKRQFYRAEALALWQGIIDRGDASVYELVQSFGK